MTESKDDILISLMFITGIYCFVSGLFIASTFLFGSAAIFSNIVTRAKLNS